MGTALRRPRRTGPRFGTRSVGSGTVTSGEAGSTPSSSGRDCTSASRPAAPNAPGSSWRGTSPSPSIAWWVRTKASTTTASTAGDSSACRAPASRLGIVDRDARRQRRSDAPGDVRCQPVADGIVLVERFGDVAGPVRIEDRPRQEEAGPGEGTEPQADAEQGGGEGTTHLPMMGHVPPTVAAGALRSAIEEAVEVLGQDQRLVALDGVAGVDDGDDLGVGLALGEHRPVGLVHHGRPVAEQQQ